MVTTVEHPTAGELALTGVPFQMFGTPAAVRRPPPTLGRHSREVLTGELGLDDAALVELLAAGSPPSNELHEPDPRPAATKRRPVHQGGCMTTVEEQVPAERWPELGPVWEPEARLTEQSRPRILGANAARLFGIGD